MISAAEHLAAQQLRPLLEALQIGSPIEDSEEFRDVLLFLERFIPEVLLERHPECGGMILDGILPVAAAKTGEGEAEIFGLAYLIADQTLVRLHLRLQIALERDAISWLECRLGERWGNDMIRIPNGSARSALNCLRYLIGRELTLDWFYEVGYGHKRDDR